MYIALYYKPFISRALRYGPGVTTGSHSFTCHPRTNQTCVYSQPQGVTALWLVIYVKSNWIFDNSANWPFLLHDDHIHCLHQSLVEILNVCVTDRPEQAVSAITIRKHDTEIRVDTRCNTSVQPTLRIANGPQEASSLWTLFTVCGLQTFFAPQSISQG